MLLLRIVPSWFPIPEELKRNGWPQLKRIQWMNERGSADRAYIPTPIEHIANVVTHGIWILPSIYASALLVRRSSSWQQYWAALVYGASLVLCFTVSTFFHSAFYCGKSRQLKEMLHRGDRAIIYVFIAASYFPWLLLRPLPPNSWISELWWLIWVFALLGILYQQVYHERYKSLETFFYLFLGVVPALALVNKVAATKTEFSGLGELKAGGLLYVLGVVFFKCDGKIPCAHAIWHLFVASAASFHYFAILHHLYMPSSAATTVDIPSSILTT